MNERLQELLDAVQRTASQVGGSAADAAYLNDWESGRGSSCPWPS